MFLVLGRKSWFTEFITSINTHILYAKRYIYVITIYYDFFRRQLEEQQNISLIQTREEKVEKQDTISRGSTFRALKRNFGCSLFWAGLLKLACDILHFAEPFFLQLVN